MNIKIMVFWDVTPCSLVDRYQNFGKTWCFHHEVPSKCWCPSSKLQSIISQKAETSMMNLYEI
jgi:hypothetical protein